jgi:hypothetical protein
VQEEPSGMSRALCRLIPDLRILMARGIFTSLWGRERGGGLARQGCNPASAAPKSHWSNVRSS